MRNAAILLFISVLVLSACKKNPPPPIPGHDTTTITAQTITVHTILTHSRDTSFAAADTTHSFDVRDTIHGIIRTENAKDDLPLIGRWYYLKTGQKIAENSARLSAGTNLSHFDLVNAAQWPLGQYKLLVVVDSAIKDSVEFTLENKR